MTTHYTVAASPEIGTIGLVLCLHRPLSSMRTHLRTTENPYAEGRNEPQMMVDVRYGRGFATLGAGLVAFSQIQHVIAEGG